VLLATYTCVPCTLRRIGPTTGDEEYAVTEAQVLPQRDWDYKVVGLIKPVDGDTYDLIVEKEMDFGFHLIERKRWASRFRLLHADAWEHNQAGGAAAKSFATQWISARINTECLRGQTFKSDSFGRYLIDLYDTVTKESLSNALKANGLVKPTSRWNA